MKKRINTLLLFLLSAISSNAQIDLAFVKHLSDAGLKTEHKIYVNSFPANDSIFYLKAKFHLQYAEDSLLIESYKHAKIICDTDSNFYKKANAYFLNTDHLKFQKQWFNLTYKSDFSKVYEAALKPELYNPAIFPEQLQPAFRSYKKAARKNAYTAAVLSGIIPGAGKLYAGKTRTSLLNFLVNVGYAAQTIESSVKLGNKHPLTIVNVSAFAIFYLSNIYGSYKAVTDLKKERKKQFLSEAAGYYN